MKTIYSLLFTLSISVISIGQSSISLINDNSSGLTPTNRKIPTKSFLKTSAAGMSGRFDPGYAVMTLNGVLDTEIGGGTAGTKVGLFVSPTNCDSTTKSSFNTTSSFISVHKFGMNFDPYHSIAYNQVTFAPLLSMTESYYVDTVWIGNFYQRVTNFNDTLLVEVVWGDTANTTVYAPFSFAAANAYMGTFLGPKFNTSTSQGNTSFLTAPLLNRKVIKYVLTAADTVVTNNTGYLPIVVNGAAGQLIPAGNIVSAVATFVPGQPSIPVGSISYNPGAGAFPQTVNGMAARLYVQNAPSPPVSGQNWFDDLSVGKNHTVYTFKRERYGMAGAFPGLRSSSNRAYMTDFSIHTDAVTSVKSLQNNTFSLTQNIPNPYTKESIVSYKLSSDANSALFTVTDIMGRVVSSEKAGTTTGSHSVKLGAYAAGVYYYSLNVDGNLTTKKMIVE